MNIGILTGGGDCPGLNAAIRAIVKKGLGFGHDLYGIKKGWAGLLEDRIERLDEEAVSGILPKGGTILGTSRTNPTKNLKDIKRCLATARQHQLGAVIAIGGEDTLGVAYALSRRGLRVIGIPKTIDNDLPGTEYCLGFDTAVTTVMDAIDKLHSTAESHDRVMVVEVMGRHSGWIAAVAGVAGGADFIVVPEIPYEIEKLCTVIRRRKERGRNFSIVVVAEGSRPKGSDDLVTLDSSRDPFGHIKLGGVGAVIAETLKTRLKIDVRVTILGHIQRGGTPSPYDRLMGTRFGLKAIELANTKRFGRLVALKGGKIADLPLNVVSQGPRALDLRLYHEAEVFFG